MKSKSFFLIFFLLLICGCGKKDAENVVLEELVEAVTEPEYPEADETVKPVEESTEESKQEETATEEDIRSYRWQKVKEGEEADFLKQEGFSEENLFYEYSWEDGCDFILQFYYLKEEKRGGGLITVFGVEGLVADIVGFSFEGCEEFDASNTDPFSVHYNYGEFILLSMEELEELEEQRTEGEILKDYEEKRLMHMYSYETHGGTEYFYIYDGDNDMPTYLLMLDVGWELAFCEFK